ncbi:hypothetical protein K474DRAFT_1726713 [Panus rudis PR-1116 ss-1]|nr:hypothetical protein K474DRAFT_1726713 [Panus rudis PR-1116 ss-1]
MQKTLRKSGEEILSGNAWKKFVNPSVNRGKTVWPQKSVDQQRFGIRFDYDKVVKKPGDDTTEYHLFKMQPNSGDGIPSSIKQYRNKYGTDAVMAQVWVKKDGTKEDVEAALNESFKQVQV